MKFGAFWHNLEQCCSLCPAQVHMACGVSGATVLLTKPVPCRGPGRDREAPGGQQEGRQALRGRADMAGDGGGLKKREVGEGWTASYSVLLDNRGVSSQVFEAREIGTPA